MTLKQSGRVKQDHHQETWWPLVAELPDKVANLWRNPPQEGSDEAAIHSWHSTLRALYVQSTPT